MFPYSRYKYSPYLSATLVSLFQRSFLSRNFASRLAPSLPFWDCKSTAFFLFSKFFLCFFLLFISKWLISCEIIFVVFLSYFCVIGGFYTLFLLFGWVVCMFFVGMYDVFMVFYGCFLWNLLQKNNFRGRLNIFYNIPKV